VAAFQIKVLSVHSMEIRACRNSRNSLAAGGQCRVVQNCQPCHEIRLLQRRGGWLDSQVSSCRISLAA